MKGAPPASLGTAHAAPLRAFVRALFATLFSTLLALAFSAPALADVDVEVELGHGGRWVADAITPVTVTLENSGDEGVEVEIVLQQAAMFAKAEFLYERRVYLNPGGARRELFLIPGPAQIGARVALDLETSPSVPLHAGRKTATRGVMSLEVRSDTASDAQALQFAEQIIGVVGDVQSKLVSRLPLGYDTSAYTPGIETPFQLATMHVSPEVLAIAPLALDGIDALVVCDPDGSFAADPAVADALLDWVALGGHLVISLGTNAAPFGSSGLAAELPATWLTAERRSYTHVFEGLARGWGEKLDRKKLTQASGPYVDISPSAVDAGTADGAPLAFPDTGETLRLTRRLGYGHVSVLPFDVRELAGAAGTAEDLYRIGRLLQIAAPPRPSPNDQEMDYWSDELSQSISNVVQQGAFSPPPLPCIMLGLLAYVLLVGPVDWFVLKRLRKERLTTLTFSVTVVGFTVLAYGATMVLFSGGASVNRVTFVDIVDGGRGGRQLFRVQDIAGFYEPTGGSREIAFDHPAVVLDGGLPGMSDGAQVGLALPVNVGGADAITPQATIEVAIRSQRVVRSVIVGTFGRDLDVTWDGSLPIVANGLPVDLDAVYVLAGRRTYDVGELKAGLTSDKTRVDRLGSRPAGNWASLQASLTRDPTAGQIANLLTHMSLAADLNGGPLWTPSRITVDPMRLSRYRTLRKAGIDRSAVLDGGHHGLLIAFSRTSPVPLPGSDAPGNRYIVIRKEITLP